MMQFVLFPFFLLNFLNDVTPLGFKPKLIIR
jgi:hypothetical protein